MKRDVKMEQKPPQLPSSDRDSNIEKHLEKISANISAIKWILVVFFALIPVMYFVVYNYSNSKGVEDEFYGVDTTEEEEARIKKEMEQSAKGLR